MRTGSFGRTAINVKLEKVTNDIADIKKGKPMTFAEADTGNVNPHYVPHTATADNCQSCVPAFMARLDGFDVQAKAFDESNEIMVALSENTSLAWIDKATGSFPEYIKPNERYMSRLMSWFDDNLENNKYYSIEFYWKDFTPDGHIMMIAKHNGALMIYDPQNNLKLFGKDIERFLYTTRLGTIKIMNLSDCFLNKSVVDFVLEERK